jgi:hypothetical protein
MESIINGYDDWSRCVFESSFFTFDLDLFTFQMLILITLTENEKNVKRLCQNIFKYSKLYLELYKIEIKFIIFYNFINYRNEHLRIRVRFK